MEQTIKIGYVRKYDETLPSQYVRVRDINETNHPWVDIEQLSDGRAKRVHRRFLKPIQTTKEHMQQIGFIEYNYGGMLYYKFGNICIGSIARRYNVPEGNGLFISGFRLVEREDFWNDMNRFFPNDIFDQDGFDRTFPEVNELNTLIEYLNRQGFAFRIEDLLEDL